MKCTCAANYFVVTNLIFNVKIIHVGCIILKISEEWRCSLSKKAEKVRVAG